MICVVFDILLYAGKWERRRNSLRKNILMALRSTRLGEPDSVKIEVLDGDPRVVVHVAISDEDCDAEAIVDLLHAAVLHRLCPQYESQVESEIICIRDD
jgi:hypothetical protein